jgi:hypothetical protein
MNLSFRISAILAVFATVSMNAIAQKNSTRTTAAAAQTVQPVIVTNTDAQPVPVQVTNPVQPPSSVMINNTPAQAVPVKDLSSAAEAPIWGDIATANFTQIGSATVTLTNSTGKRVMVRYISFRCQMPGTAEIVVQTSGSFGISPLIFPLETKFASATWALAVGGTPVELMVDAGSHTDFIFNRSGNIVGGTCQAYLLGYTVPQPLNP